MVAKVKLTEQTLRRLRASVEAGEEPLEVIARRYGRSRKTIVALIREYGWHNPWNDRQKRHNALAGGIGAKRILKRTKANSYLTNPAKFVADRRAEVEAVERELYGSLLGDVKFLRQRGWAINAERDGFRVGNAVIDGAALTAKAARERRLTGVGIR